VETMVRDAHEDLSAAAGQPAPPRMFRRPSDPPAPPPHVTDSPELRSVRETTYRRSQTRRARRTSVRRWLARSSGGSDRHLVAALADATTALATHCDLLADRLASQEVLTEDVTGTLGTELTRLRAQVWHLQGLIGEKHRGPRD
jgi:hypothetical protein